MQQTVKVECDFRLYELKKAVTEFLEFTENLTLFQAVNDKAQEIVQAVDVLQMVLKQDLSADDFFQLWMLRRQPRCLKRSLMSMLSVS